MPYLSEGALEEFRLEVDLTLLFPDAMKRKKKAEGGDGGDSSSGGKQPILVQVKVVAIVLLRSYHWSRSNRCPRWNLHRHYNVVGIDGVGLIRYDKRVVLHGDRVRFLQPSGAGQD